MYNSDVVSGGRKSFFCHELNFIENFDKIFKKKTKLTLYFDQ